MLFCVTFYFTPKLSKMDKLLDFSKELKTRISNPFISSFLISWAIINWRILIGLFFYKNQELNADGYSSYIDFISQNISPQKSFFGPMFTALTYTFAFPFFRNCIFAFNAWIQSWGTTWNLNISKSSKISVSKYIELREVYKDRTELLQSVLDKEGQYLKDYETLKNEHLSMTEQKNDLYHQLESWKTANNSDQLNGQWEIHYPNTQDKPVYRVQINHGTIDYIDNPPANRNGRTTIRFFFRSPDRSYLSFVLSFEDENRNRTFHLLHLNIMDNMNLLRGKEDEIIDIELKRVN